MAQLEWLLSQIELVKEEYSTRNRIAEENRVRETRAAVRIQRWLRGCQVRARLRHLHRKAIIIQKVWRGFRARVCFRQMVKTACFVMKMNFYEEMATRIQKRWRGYYVRKYVHNYYARKKYLEGLMIKNEQVRRDLEAFAEGQRRERERSALEREEQRKTLQAQRMHFLLSTFQTPGVFNSPYRDAPHEMELRMRSVKPLLTRSVPQKRLSAGWPTDPSVQGAPQAFIPLPPIHRKKPQGPFREPAEVLQQRYRPLEPTLCVETSFTALQEAQEEQRREEWRGRVVDHIFQPFSNVHKNRKYEKTLHSTSSYERMAYGTQHFREEDQQRLRHKKPFKTVFTTSHVFDKFGRYYSNAGKTV